MKLTKKPAEKQQQALEGRGKHPCFLLVSLREGERPQHMQVTLMDKDKVLSWGKLSYSSADKKNIIKAHSKESSLSRYKVSPSSPQQNKSAAKN
eukprot:4098549-Ditylum_brightwellii.AAC.1